MRYGNKNDDLRMQQFEMYAHAAMLYSGLSASQRRLRKQQDSESAGQYRGKPSLQDCLQTAKPPRPQHEISFSQMPSKQQTTRASPLNTQRPVSE